MNNLSRFKKVVFIIVFLALISVIAYFLWITFLRPDEFTIPAPGQSTTTPPGTFPDIGIGTNEPGGEITGPGQLPGDFTPGISPDSPTGQIDPEAFAPDEVASGGFTQTQIIVKEKTVDPSLNANGSINYYNSADGYFYKIDSNGNITKLSDRVFHKVEAVTWAPNTDKAIIEYPDDTKISYDFNSEKQITLPSYWEEFSFSPNGEQIAAKSIGLDEDNRWLIVSGSDTSQAYALESIGNRAGYVYPSWSPNNQIVAYYTKGVDFDRQEIFFVGLNGENFKSTVVEGRGVETTWSKTGNNLLYSAYHSRDSYKPKLWIVSSSGDTIGSNRRSLELNTWASKCTFASETDLYCAVPEELPEGAGMFPEVADTTRDLLYKIDLKTGAKSLLAIPEGAYNISSLIVPENQQYLYFTDNVNGNIHQMRLE